MSNLVLVTVCVASWVLTLGRLKTISSSSTKATPKRGMAVNVWAMLLFFSITITFMIDQVAVFFNTHTFHNISLLITHIAFLSSQYFATASTLAAIGIPATQRTLRWVRYILGALFIVLVGIYALFLGSMPEAAPDSTQYLPIIVFKFFSYPFGVLLCFILVITCLAYLPSRDLALMRTRAIMIILCALTVGIYILTRSVIYAGYFWPALATLWLIAISNVLLVCSAILFCGALLSDRLYAHAVLLTKSFESWMAFRDLENLMDRLEILCPVVALPSSHPPIWVFFSNPEYYLYRAIVIILDGKAMLADFLAQSAEPEQPPRWSGALLQEATRLNIALQSAASFTDFYEIVAGYRQISRALFAGVRYEPARVL